MNRLAAGLNRDDSGQRQFPDQPLLEGAKGALGPALGGVEVVAGGVQ